MSKRNTNTELRDRFLERIKKPGCPSVRTIAEEMQLAKEYAFLNPEKNQKISPLKEK